MPAPNQGNCDKRMHPPLRNIFFDAGGTLIHLPRGAAGHYVEVARRHGLDLDESRVNLAFRQAWKEAPAPLTTRTPRHDDDRGWWRMLVDRVLDQCGIGEFDRDAYFDELYAEFARPGVWAVYPEVREIVERLAPRYTLGILSNFDGRLRPVLEDLELARYFQHIVISSEVGADKPDSWIFTEAARIAGVAGESILHVGDEPAADWQGATEAGWQVFRLERPKNSLAELESLLR